jgi:hypothetical protein
VTAHKWRFDGASHIVIAAQYVTLAKARNADYFARSRHECPSFCVRPRTGICWHQYPRLCRLEWLSTNVTATSDPYRVAPLKSCRWSNTYVRTNEGIRFSGLLLQARSPTPATASRRTCAAGARGASQATTHHRPRCRDYFRNARLGGAAWKRVTALSVSPQSGSSCGPRIQIAGIWACYEAEGELVPAGTSARE